MNYPEHQIQAAFFKWARMEKGIPLLDTIYVIPNAAKRSVRMASIMKAEGMLSGVWDVHWPVPRGRYAGLWIEFKAGKNGLSENQVLFRNKLQEFFKFVVCYDWLSAANTVRAYSRQPSK